MRGTASIEKTCHSLALIASKPFADGSAVDLESPGRGRGHDGPCGMVVMDESSCVVDVGRYFLESLQDESCGKRVPCRLGIERMLEIVGKITAGRGTETQLALLEELGETVGLASLCALGKTAPNPVLTTMRYFREEYKARISEKRCPAGVCRGLIRYTIDPGKCTGCGACLRACPKGLRQALMPPSSPWWIQRRRSAASIN